MEINKREMLCLISGNIGKLFTVLRKILFLLVISLVIIHPIQAQKDYTASTLVDTAAETSDVCVMVAAQMESKYGIKEHLLQTISSVETGRWDYKREEFVSWPWTINVNGRGYHFATKDEAVAEVKRLQAKGIKSIDVGCMQISLKYHGTEFASLEDAFDPQINAEYSAKFLSKLYQKRKDWQWAAMAYHSKIPSRGLRYKKKLLSRFEEIKVALLDKGENKTLF